MRCGGDCGGSGLSQGHTGGGVARGHTRRQGGHRVGHREECREISHHHLYAAPPLDAPVLAKHLRRTETIPGPSRTLSHRHGSARGSTQQRGAAGGPSSSSCVWMVRPLLSLEGTLFPTRPQAKSSSRSSRRTPVPRQHRTAFNVVRQPCQGQGAAPPRCA